MDGRLDAPARNRYYFGMVEYLRWLGILACLALASACSSSGKRWTYQYQPGRTAILMQGLAVPPANLPHQVMRAIAAGNAIHGRPYRYGGGHARFDDQCYDCSGSVSYVLHHAGFLSRPTTSDALRKFGSSGEGKWITVYAKDGHAFVVVAGLRFDTGGGSGDVNRGPKWTTDSRSLKGFKARHPAGL